MKNTPPSAQTEWEKEFDQKFTYTDEDGNVFLLGGYDDDKKANTDNIPEIKLFIRKLLASERTRLLSVESMKHSTHKMTMKMHDDGGTSPCLHCSCGSTWGATERAMSHLINEHNERQSILSEMEKGSV